MSGGEYIWFAKGNQSQIEQDNRLWFEPDIQPIPGMGCPPKISRQLRNEQRSWASGNPHPHREQPTQDFLDWLYLEQVFKLERRCMSLKTGEIQEQVAYGFTSLMRTEITPRQLLNKIRSYWGIENGLHYRRDVTLKKITLA